MFFKQKYHVKTSIFPSLYRWLFCKNMVGLNHQVSKSLHPNAYGSPTPPHTPTHLFLSPVSRPLCSKKPFCHTLCVCAAPHPGTLPPAHCPFVRSDIYYYQYLPNTLPFFDQHKESHWWIRNVGSGSHLYKGKFLMPFFRKWGLESLSTSWSGFEFRGSDWPISKKYVPVLSSFVSVSCVLGIRIRIRTWASLVRIHQSEVRIRLQILLFSHKCVERTDILPAKIKFLHKILAKNYVF
jgi:hypothetical protein